MNAQNPSANAPPRGFPDSEFRARLDRCQAAMSAAGMDALLVTTEAEVRYFTGFKSQFWESPTRPWYVLVPVSGKPLAVIPEIGAAGMARTWIEDIRTWPAPVPDDDGVSLLIDAVRELCGQQGVLGVPLGHETMLRMPAGDFLRLRDAIAPVAINDAGPLVRRLRMIKSEAEIEKIHQACEIVSMAFQAFGESVQTGMSERALCSTLRKDILERGADSTPYLIGASGPGGYDNIIMGPTDRETRPGDVLIIDTGSTWDGYFCDFDRNWGFTACDESTRRAYQCVYDATEAGFNAARPGVRTREIWQAMWKVLESGGALGNDVGRMGHGLGMQLTEPPSLNPLDDTVLEPGMVITLEPGMTFAPGRQMVHEENIVIREHGAQWLTRRAEPQLPIIR